MIELSEQQVIDGLAQRLADTFPTLPTDAVSQVVQQKHQRFDGSRVRDFVPLFVERFAREELLRLGV